MVFKTALGVLSGLVALPVVLAWAVPPLLDGDSLSPLLQDELSALLGHPVRIGGNTVIRLLPSPSLTADSLDIFDPGAEHQAVSSATVQKARVEFPLLPLLQGRLELNTLELDTLNLQGVPTITRLTAQRGVTGDIQGKLDISGLSLDFSARFSPGTQVTLTDSQGAVLNFSGSISEHGVELAGPVELTMPAPDRSLARFGGFLPTQPLKISAQVTVDQGQVEVTNLAGLLGDAAIIGAFELIAGHDLTVRMTTNGLDMDRWILVVPADTAATSSAVGSRLEAAIPVVPVLPRVQMAVVNESFTLGGLVWPAARLLLETANEQVMLKLAEVDIPGGRIQLSGEGSITGDTYFDGTLVLSTRDRQIFGAWLGREAVDFSMTVPINWVRQGVNLTPMTGRWNNTDLYGGLSLIPQENGQVLVVDVKTPQGDFGLHSTVTLDSDKVMNFSDFSAQIGSFTMQGAVQAGWDEGRPRFAAMLTSPPLAAPVTTTGSGGITGGTGNPLPHQDQPDMIGLLGLITVASEVPVGNSSLDWQGSGVPFAGDLWLDQPRLRVVWQDDGIVLDSLNGRWAGGTLLVKGAILRDPAAKDGRRLEAYAHLSEGDISTLDLPIGPVAVAGGRFEVEGNLFTEGRTATAWLAGLGGSLRFDAQNGHIRGLNLPSVVASVRAYGLGGLLRQNRKTLLSGVTPFRSLTATAIVDGEWVNIDDFDLRMDTGQITAQSHLNWSKGNAETDVTLALDGLMPMPFSLDGPLANPKVTADARFKIQKAAP